MKASRLTAAVVVFFLVVLALAGHYRMMRDRATPFGKLTAQDVLAQSEPLCKLFAPPSANLQLTAARHADSGHRLWSVTCEDEKQQYVAELIWDGDSGEIRHVGRNATGLNRNGMSLDEESMVRLAETWLRDLGIAASGPEWRLLGKPEQLAHHCVVRFNSGSKNALLKLDRSSGNLLTAEQWSRQASPLGSL